MVNDALVVATSKVAFAEARAAFVRVYREGSLRKEDYRSAVEAFQAEWGNYLRLEVSDELICLAGDLAERHRLRGFDAIHLASLQMLSQQVGDPVIVACWDTRLWDAVKGGLLCCGSGGTAGFRPAPLKLLCSAWPATAPARSPSRPAKTSEKVKPPLAAG